MLIYFILRLQNEYFQRAQNYKQLRYLIQQEIKAY